MTQKVHGWSQPSAILMYGGAAGGDEARGVFVVKVRGEEVSCALPFVTAETALALAVVAFGAEFSFVGAGEGFLAGADFAGAGGGEDVEERGRDGGGAGDAGGFEDGLEFASPDDSVDLGNAFADLVAVPFDEAAGNDELLRVALGFEAGHLEDGVDGFLLGGVDERAGVDDDNFGVFGLGGQARAAAIEEAHHDLGVDQVFGAA